MSLMPDGKAVYGNVRKGVLLMLFLLCTIPSGLFAWEGVIVHHTASNQMTREECDAWHKARGWEDCGYHFIIQKSGLVNEARPLTRNGAHCLGRNSTHIGVAIVGNGEANGRQIEALRQLLARLRTSNGPLRLEPHFAYRQTECPTEAVWEKIKAEML